MTTTSVLITLGGIAALVAAQTVWMVRRLNRMVRRIDEIAAGSAKLPGR